MKIIKNKILAKNSQEVSFPFKIKKTYSKNNITLVLLEVPIDVIYNENIFCIDEFGNLKWQIGAQKYLYEHNSYVNFREDVEGNIWLINWDGSQYMIDPLTGKILDKKFLNKMFVRFAN